MPLAHALRDHCIWITTEGDVEYGDGLASLERALEAARAENGDAGWDIAFDIRRSSEHRSAQELRGIVDYVADRRPLLSGRCVVIASSDYLFGVSRMFQAYCELRELTATVVRDEESAREWLKESSPNGS